MNEQDLLHFKAKLTEELKTLEEELGSIGTRNPSNPADWVATPGDAEAFEADQNDTADRMEALDENAAIVVDLEGRYNAVQKALQKIEGGTYGVCEISGEAIERDRLEANPAAVTCIKHMNETR